VNSAGKYMERWESQFVFYTPLLAIILLIFPPNTLFVRHRPIRPVRLTGFQQARQAFTLGLGLYRDCGPLTERGPVWLPVAGRFLGSQTRLLLPAAL